MTIIATIVLLGVLIFVHELGHFLAARSVGVGVERFSIGLGPRIAGFQRGETEYVISAIPLGGYVKLAGMNDEVMEYIEGGSEEEEGAEDAEGAGDAGSGATSAGRAPQGGEAASGGPGAGDGPPSPGAGDFDSKPVWARAWVISAGVVMNMLFAFVAYAAVAAGWGTPELDTTRLAGVRAEALPEEARGLEEIPSGATLVRIGDREPAHWGEVRDAILEAPGDGVTITFQAPDGEVFVGLPTGEERRRQVVAAMGSWSEPVIRGVNPGSPAARAGLQEGDRILAVDDDPVDTWFDFVLRIQASPETEVRLTVLRDGGELYREVTPDAVRGQDAATGEIRTIGQVGAATDPAMVFISKGPFEAVKAGWDETVYVTGFILSILRDLVTGQLSPRNLGSIVAIGEMSGQAAAEGFHIYLRFMALFSINLAILNLLPIPVLDGGHLVFLGIEAVRGRPLSVEARVRWSQVGFVVLIGIMALALGNDFLRLFGL
jgi:regulator of sigma E protease